VTVADALISSVKVSAEHLTSDRRTGRQINGRTDRQTQDQCIYRASIGSRDKN